MASQSPVFIVWLLCSLCLSFNQNGVQGSLKLSPEEHIEIDKQLKILNKPSVKTIKTDNGDLYDCVDFYKQPAFDHPLLKNHSFHYQMKPSSMPTSLGDNEGSTNDVYSAKGFGCPFGTVPIKRVTKADLIRAKLYTKQHNSSVNSKYDENTVDLPGTHFSILQTIFSENKTYNGLSATMSVYNPRPLPSQTSSGRIRIQNSGDSVQAGWTTNAALYGNNDVRFYIHTKTATQQCFNVLCPGFVLVHDYPVDSILPASVRRGNTTIYMNVIIYRDGVNGNWWVAVDEYFKSRTRNRRPIGFWPHGIFTGLMHLARTVDWGGEVSGPTDVPSAPMGSGFNITLDILRDAYMFELGTIDYGGHTVAARNLEIYNDNPIYNIYDTGYDDPPLVDHTIVYGGAGGCIGN